MSDGDFITDVELDVIHFIERYHASMGETPTDAQIKQRFNRIDDTWLRHFQANELVQRSFTARGILYPSAADRFTPEQMHAAATMLDPYDRRSEQKKLADLGITTREWSQWLQDSAFAEYLRARSELMLTNSMHEAHKGLIKGIRNGNVASIKTYYEITGRHDPNKESAVNIGVILHTFIEVIQKFVKDPITLHAIATELSNIASRESFTNGLAASMVTGAPMGLQSSRPAIQGTALKAPVLAEEDDGE